MMAKLGGYLKPNGEWVTLPYYGHQEWAEQECETKGWLPGLSQIDTLFDHGYLQISEGNPFFVGRGITMLKLSRRQLDFLLEHADELMGQGKKTLVDNYGIILPDTLPTPTPTILVEPSFDRRTDG